MDRIKLKWKVFAFLICFSAILLLVLWLFQTVFLNDFYKAIKTKEVKDNINTITQNIDSINIKEQIDVISKNSDCYVEIIDSSLNTIVSAGGGKDLIPYFKKLEIISNMGDDDYIENFFADSPIDANPNKKMGNSIIYVRKINDRYIIIDSFISPVDATISTLKIQLYYVTGIMILLAIIIALIISYNVSKPIEKINESAKELSKGNYDIKFDGHGFLEIKELSNTLNKASEDLSKVDKLRKELLANISHDLRTPLTLIYGYAEYMNDFPDEITSKQTQIIMDESKRLSGLVNDILDVSKIESGNYTLNKEKFDLTDLIKKTVDRVSELVKREGYKIEFSYSSPHFVFADSVKISQVFYNLLINAITYGGEDKVVKVKESENNGKVKIEVIDNGKGIAKDSLPYVWDRYYKVYKSHKRAIIGTGLGLSIVKKIIDLHGGTCGVTSKENIGSDFFFELDIIE